MKLNRLLNIEIPEYGTLLVKKSRGRLTFDDIYDALDSESIEDTFVLFVKGGTRYDGWEYKNDISEILLYNLTSAERCPVCAIDLGARDSESYQRGYNDGYQVGISVAQHPNV